MSKFRECGQYIAIVNLSVPISPGELLDKLTILEIKAARIEDAAKKKNVLHELDSLQRVWRAAGAHPPVDAQIADLRSVNEILWDVEDDIRRKEARREFDEEFIELARSVYRMNDRRSALKRELNVALGSDLIEEKSYAGEEDAGAESP